MKRVLVFVSSLVLSATAFAADVGVEVGFRQQSGKSSLANQSSESRVGYVLGVSAFFPVSGAFGVRTGMFYVERPLLLKATGGAGEAKIGLSYFDIPVLAAYKFEEYAMVFAGPVFSLKANDSVSGDSGTLSGVTLSDTSSLIVPVQIGASFKFAPQLGATVYFETVPGDVAKNVGEYRAVGANLVITFE